MSGSSGIRETLLDWPLQASPDGSLLIVRHGEPPSDLIDRASAADADVLVIQPTYVAARTGNVCCIGHSRTLRLVEPSDPEHRDVALLVRLKVAPSPDKTIAFPTESWGCVLLGEALGNRAKFERDG